MQNRLIRDIRFNLLSQYYEWKGFFFYRTQASIWLVQSIVNLVFSYVAVSVIYGISSGIAGWSYYQMLFLVSTSTIVLSMLKYFLEPGWINQLLRYGGIDAYLTKPYGKASIFLTPSAGVVLHQLVEQQV